MQRAIIMMETAKEMYSKALENMKSELIAASVDNVRTPKESVVVKVEIKAEPLPEPPAIIEVPEEVMNTIIGNDFDKDEEIMVANKLCIIAGLDDVKGDLVLVGFKQFYNEGQDTPYVSRHQVNISILDKYGEEIASRYVKTERLSDTEMYLRKRGGLRINKDFAPSQVLLALK